MLTILGDSRFFWNENIKDFATLPSAWDSILNTGLGQSQLGSLWITSFLNLTSLASNLGLSWGWIQVLFWVLPAIVISFLSSYLLFNHLFKNRIYAILSGLIYLFNTYFLMVLTGGQLGVSLGYSLTPLVLLAFIKLSKTPSLRNSVLAGLALGVQLLFDPRIVLITLLAIFVYSLFNYYQILRNVKKYITFFLVPFLISILLHSFWILPLLLTKTSSLPQGFGSIAGFSFFSFADFSHAFSLLHPNWPENIFGKVYFLQPEFLVLPILALSSFVFLKGTIGQSNNRTIVFFSFLALTGAFLAKGVNPPFGQVNEWIFQNVPGMVVFRDPTKWYILISLSYSMLIPFTIYSTEQWFLSKIKNQKSKIQSKYLIFNFSYVFLIFTILYLIFLSSPILGQIKTREVPRDYVVLKDLLSMDKEFSRTLWIPQWQRFGFFSANHPAIGREEVLEGSVQDQVEELKKEETEELLRNLSVKYVIIPFDSEGEIFLTDRKYDGKNYQRVVEDVGGVEWLSPVAGFDNLAVFEVENPRGHFWSPSSDIQISYGYVKPTEYEVQIGNAKEGDILVFSEGFDKNWTVRSASIKYQVSSIKYGEGLNSFVLPEGSYELRVYYEPQSWVNVGLLVST
ncbi:MAG: hypothetical protein WD967_01870, partial [Candidatus Levyibacteriota bacterium]